MGIEAIGFGEGTPGPMRAWATLLTQIENELLVALGTSESGPTQAGETGQLNQLNQLNKSAGTTATAGTVPTAQAADSAPPPSGGLTQIARQLPLLVQTAQVGVATELATSSLRSAVDVLTTILATLDALPASPTPAQLQVAQQAVRAAVASLPQLPVVVDEPVSPTPTPTSMPTPAPTVPVELAPAIGRLLDELLPEGSPTVNPSPSPTVGAGTNGTPVERLQTLAQSLERLQILDSLASGPFTSDRALTSATLDAVRAALEHTNTVQHGVTDAFRALGLRNEAVSLDAARAAVAELSRNPSALVQGMLTTRLDVSAATVLMLLQGAIGPTAPRPFEGRIEDDPIEHERCDDCVYWSLCRFGCWRQRYAPETPS